MDLSTKYLGLTLRNPLVVSPSPLCEDLGNIRKMEDSGAGAVVLHSLFEEQIAMESYELDRYLSHGAESFAESLSYFPDLTGYNLGPEGYLEHLAKAKAAVKVPIIASLNGVSTGGWIRYAQKMEQAGADALELNIYSVPTNPEVSSAQIEQAYCELVHDVKASVGIPVAVKVGPYFTAMANLARALEEAGADGLVLFNRFYQPDLDLETFEVVPRLELSGPSELRLPMRWTAILRPQLGPAVALAASSGIHGGTDAVKALMVGADVAMTTSALLHHGPEHLRTIEAELVAWMTEHEYESVDQLRGSASQATVEDPSAFERANYMRTLRSWTSTRNTAGATRS